MSQHTSRGAADLAGGDVLVASPRSEPVAVDDREAGPRSSVEAAVTLVATTGLLLQCIGYAVAPTGREFEALALWFLGLVTMVAPYAWHLMLPHRSGRQRLVTGVGFGALMEASFILYSPVLPRHFDESLHVTTVVDLVERSQFFHANDMLAVSPYYPGLELATAGLHWLTGLPLVLCMALVEGFCRILFMAALFLLASRIGRSTWVGSATILLYGASAQFYYYNAQYAYQTMAIALVIVALYLLVRAFDSEEERPWRELAAVQVCLGALALTHHLTSWGMLALLWVLVLMFRSGSDTRRYRITLVTAEIGTVVVLAWTAAIAPLLISYLKPIFDTAGVQLLSALEGSGTRSVGTATDGSRAPTWQILTMAASVLLWCLLLLPAGYRAWRGGTIGWSRARYVPLLVALSYPALQVARLAPNAGEVADRASTFVCLAVALVVGAWLAANTARIGRVGLVLGMVVLVVGGTLVGSGPNWRLIPGPFLAGGQQRTTDGDTVAAAQWAGRYLPEGSRVAADLNVLRVLPNFAPVTLVLPSSGDDSMTPVYMADQVDPQVLSLLLGNDVDFVFVDTRLENQRSKIGDYFEDTGGYTADPGILTTSQVAKFEEDRRFKLVLDGPVRVYDIRGIDDRPRPFANRADPGVPGSWVPWQVALTLLLLALVAPLRGGLVDPRRFRARDTWRLAVVVPGLMVAGAAGVISGFSPAIGALVLAWLLVMAIRYTRRPVPIRARSRGSVGWLLATLVVGGLAIGISVASSHHQLLDHDPLPPPPDLAPASAVSSSGASGSGASG